MTRYFFEIRPKKNLLNTYSIFLLKYFQDDSWIPETKMRGDQKLQEVNRAVEYATKHYGTVMIGKIHGHVYNVAIFNTHEHISNIGNALCMLPGVDYALIWYFQHDVGLIKVSLRSITARGGPDVSKIAAEWGKCYNPTSGGGGHTQAAGFEARPEFLQCLWIPE